MDTGPRDTTVLDDARALRAYAHPVRMKLVGLLRRRGPMTATQAAAALGETAGNCSFHLRQLAKWGLVEEAGGGRGRERPWRASAQFTSWPAASDDPEVAEATGALSAMVAERYAEQMRAWIARRSAEPREWQDAAAFGDAILSLTADELAGLKRAMWDLFEPYAARLADPSLRPEGAREVTALTIAFPTPPEPEDAP